MERVCGSRRFRGLVRDGGGKTARGDRGTRRSRAELYISDFRGWLGLTAKTTHCHNRCSNDWPSLEAYDVIEG